MRGRGGPIHVTAPKQLLLLLMCLQDLQLQCRVQQRRCAASSQDWPSHCVDALAAHLLLLLLLHLSLHLCLLLLRLLLLLLLRLLLHVRVLLRLQLLLLCLMLLHLLLHQSCIQQIRNRPRAR
jgi:hypothetical protein